LDSNYNMFFIVKHTRLLLKQKKETGVEAQLKTINRWIERL